MLFVPLQTSQLMRSCLTAGLFLLCLYSLTAQTYKQFGLRRVSVDGQGGDCSSGQSVSGRAWRELCYAKDVSYHIELFIDGLLYYVAVDLTTPLSWLKSPDCHAKSKGCSIIQDSQKALAEQQFTDVKVKFRFFGRQSAGRHQQDVAIVGSSDFIAGEMQNVEYAQFFAKDSRSTRELTRLLGLSLFLAPEKDRIMLNNVSVMKAQKLSFGVNGMIDGAISVRASLEASSLLAQLFANSQSSHRIVTIYLHPLSKQGILSIGDISLKHTKSRQSQIIWADMHKNLNDAISFRSAGLALTEAFMPSPQTFRVLNSSADVYLTTSSSFIFLPQDWVEQLTAMLKEKTNASCLIAKEGGVFKCKWAGLADKQKALPLAVAVALPFPHISIGIPFTTLILISDGLFIDFAIKLSKTSSVILGQPFFEQYVVFLDYDNNKLGFAHAFFHQYDKFTSILIYFLRLLLFASILLFLAYLCFNPYQQFKRFLTNKLQKLKAHFSKVHYESFNELGESESS